MALCQAKKNKLWIWKAFDRATGRLVDWECGNRNRKTLKRLLGRLSKHETEIYCSDSWEAYSQEIPADKLIQSKKGTVAIERNNNRNRHWFARFKRKTIAFSRSVEMVELTMALFARFRVNGGIDKLIALALSLFS